MVHQQSLLLKIKFLLSYNNENCYVVGKINLWWEGVYWGGFLQVEWGEMRKFSAGGDCPNPFQ